MKARLREIRTGLRNSLRVFRRPAFPPRAVLIGAVLAGFVYFLYPKGAATANAAGATPGTDEDSTARELALEAIKNPEQFNEALDARLTPEERATKEFWRWALENPSQFYVRFIKPDPAFAVPKEAEFAILNPVTATASALQQRSG